MYRWTSIVVTSGVALAACTAKQEQPAAESRPFTSDRISVTVVGTAGAPDVILVHGVGGHPDVWQPVVDSVKGRYRLHLVHINGFGGAPAGGNATGRVAAPVADEIARYVTETELTAPAVVGHSMGGSIAMMLAARHPASAGRILVIDIPPFLGLAFAPPGTPPTPEALRAMADGFRDSIVAGRDSANMFVRMVPTMTVTERAKPMLLERARSSDRATVGNSLHELILADLRPELARITVPATVLYVVPPNMRPVARFDSLTAQSYANLKGARLVRVDKSAHYIQIDQPGRVVQELDLLMRR
jgi:pimeloyl-ACP methyl ester carboxylesterase